MRKTIYAQIQHYAGKTDWKLLLFLCLILNVKLFVKLLGLLIIILLRPSFKEIFHFRKLNIPLFYPVIIAFSLLQLLIRPGQVNNNYLAVFLSGTGFWCISFLALYQLKLAVNKNEPGKLHNTLTVFYIANAVISIITLVYIMFDTGTINPYRFQGFNQKYFIGTGDIIRGLSFDTSITNAVINVSGIIYFLFRKNFGLTILCTLCLLFTGSNLVNVIMVATLIIIFIFFSNKIMKSMVVISLAIMICFIVRVFPANNNYMINYFYHLIYTHSDRDGAVADNARLNEKEDPRTLVARQYLDSIAAIQKSAAKNANEGPTLKNFKLSTIQRGPDIHSEPYQRKRNIPPQREALKTQAWLLYKDSSLFDELSRYEQWPGKIIAYQQTYNMLRSDWSHMVFGNGAGNFSSRLAFRASGLKSFAGGFPRRFRHIDSLFKYNHLYTNLYYGTKDEEKHSILNFPNSVYNQLAGEYGLSGILLFLIFYLWYFARRYKKLSYGIPLLIFMTAIFAIDYWFEQLSVVILFELLFLLDLDSTGNHVKNENP